MATAEEKDTHSWLDASRYDLETAKALLKSRRYVYVLFMCQQSLEKLLKALITVQTREFPPRIHNLARLAELTGLEISHEEQMLLERLSLYYLQSRYPPDVQTLAKTVKAAVATAHLEQTEVLWKRLRRRLQRKKSSGKR
jgi:HEPN domain-containing protein